MGCKCSKLCLPTPREQPSSAARLRKGKKGAAADPSQEEPPKPCGKVFGVPLAELERNDLMVNGVPAVVWSLVEFLRAEGMTCKGVFRVSGNARVVKKLYEAYDRCEPVTLSMPRDVHAAASLLKLYLKEIPDGLINASVFTTLCQAYQENDGDIQTTTSSWKEAIKHLPDPHVRLLRYICQFLTQVAEHSEETMMDVYNLAIVFGPNCFQNAPGTDDVQQNDYLYTILADLLTDYAEIFECEHSAEDEVCEPEPDQHLQEAEESTPAPCEEIPQCSQLEADSVASTDIMEPVTDMSDITICSTTLPDIMKPVTDMSDITICSTTLPDIMEPVIDMSDITICMNTPNRWIIITKYGPFESRRLEDVMPEVSI